MSGKNLILPLFFIAFHNPCIQAGSAYYASPGDTVIAGRLFRIAGKFRNEADYDSALYYYQVSARQALWFNDLYLTTKSHKGFTKVHKGLFQQPLII